MALASFSTRTGFRRSRSPAASGEVPRAEDRAPGRCPPGNPHSPGRPRQWPSRPAPPCFPESLDRAGHPCRECLGPGVAKRPFRRRMARLTRRCRRGAVRPGRGPSTRRSPCRGWPRRTVAAWAGRGSGRRLAASVHHEDALVNEACREIRNAGGLRAEVLSELDPGHGAITAQGFQNAPAGRFPGGQGRRIGKCLLFYSVEKKRGHFERGVRRSGNQKTQIPGQSFRSLTEELTSQRNAFPCSEAERLRKKRRHQETRQSVPGGTPCLKKARPCQLCRASPVGGRPPSPRARARSSA